MYPTQHADALRIRTASTEVVQLTAIGTIPGVAVLNAAARNGTGTARLRSSGETVGHLLCYRAPGSSTFGVPHRVEADGVYVLPDGEDPSKFVRVQVWTAYLAPGIAEGSVKLRDVFNNEIKADDVSAAEAAAGDVETTTLSLENDGGRILSQVKAWLDPSTENLEISSDGVAWSTPTGEASALGLADVPPDGSVTLHLRRTIAAGAPSDPEILNQLHLSFCGL